MVDGIVSRIDCWRDGVPLIAVHLLTLFIDHLLPRRLALCVLSVLELYVLCGIRRHFQVAIHAWHAWRVSRILYGQLRRPPIIVVVRHLLGIVQFIVAGGLRMVFIHASHGQHLPRRREVRERQLTLDLRRLLAIVLAEK